METNGTLREKVYKYLREALLSGTLVPGSFIDQKVICRNLKISRAPLRDALIQLEAEHFVEILPRRGVLIKRLTIEDIKNSYDVIAALEASVVTTEFDKIRPSHIRRLEAINQLLHDALDNEQFDTYYALNLQFHNIFISLSENALIDHILLPLKQRLYDFPRMNYDRQWELINLSEHKRFIDSLKACNRNAASSIIQYEHWSFQHHKNNLIKIYQLG